MDFASQNEEKQYKKWLKESPFNTVSLETFKHAVPNEEELLEIFRHDKKLIKEKNFIPFENFYANTFLQFLPETLTEEQEQLLNSLTWRYIAQKIEAMNKLLKHAYELLDKQDTQKAVEIIKNLAEAGHPEACYLMAAFCMQGQLIPRDAETILKYAHKAMQYVSHPRTNLILAGLYYEGYGVERNPGKAVSLILDAERHAQEDPTVYPILAEYYQDGYIVGRDVEKAAVYAYRSEGV